jgi:hypothetical protein
MAGPPRLVEKRIAQAGGLGKPFGRDMSLRGVSPSSFSLKSPVRALIMGSTTRRGTSAEDP